MPAESLSPSLLGGSKSRPPAFEMKFPLTPELALEVERRLASRMTLDPHANVNLGDSYLITSLYTDSPELDSYHRRGKLRTVKFRVRQYGADGPICLERKTKRQQLVSKRRVFISSHELDLLAVAECGANWPADWYRQQLIRHQLQPVCQISYLRKAFFASSENGPVRLTFDRDLHGRSACSWRTAPESGTPFATELVICEFKFTAALPAIFRNVIAELQLAPGCFSKYRRCMDALNLSAHTGGEHA